MKIKLCIVGAGGYGELYVKELLEHQNSEDYEITGIVDPNFEKVCNYKEKLAGVPIYAALEDFFISHKCDLAVIATPTFLHCEQIITAMRNGANVLCEKPLVMSNSQYEKIQATIKQTNLLLVVGFQWQFSKAVKALKGDIASNVWGKPLRMRLIMLNHRFSNSSWYGKKYDKNGEPLFDSIAGNPGAHYIYNMFYCASMIMGEASFPKKVQAQLMRTGVTETCDVAAVRAQTANGVDILYLGGTLAKKEDLLGTVFSYEFEKGRIEFDGKNIMGIDKDNRQTIYGDPYDEEMNKLWETIALVKNNVSTPPFSVQSTISHTVFINAMHESMPDATEIPAEYLSINDDRVVLSDIKNKFLNAYDRFDFLDYHFGSIGHEININEE